MRSLRESSPCVLSGCFFRSLAPFPSVDPPRPSQRRHEGV